MRVVPERLDEALHVFVQEGMVRDVMHPLFVLMPRRKIAVQDEIGRLEKGAVLGELLDRIAAVVEDPPVPVDHGDLALAVGGVRERRVVGHQAEVFRPGLDVAQGHRPDGAVLDRDLVRLAGAVIDDAEGAPAGGPMVHGDAPLGGVLRLGALGLGRTGHAGRPPARQSAT